MKRAGKFSRRQSTALLEMLVPSRWISLRFLWSGVWPWQMSSTPLSVTCFGETYIQAGQTVTSLTDDGQHGVVKDGVELESDQPCGAWL